MAEALKRNGDREYCLGDDDKEILLELRELLLPFHNLTKLVSNGQPTFGPIPLIIKEIREIIKHKADNGD